MLQITDEQVSHIRSKYSHLLEQKGEAYQAGTIRTIAVAEALSNVVNEIGFDYTAFAEVLGNDHRTLQQSTMRAFIAFCDEMAEHYAQGDYDVRNEAACKLADEIMELPHHLPQFRHLIQ